LKVRISEAAWADIRSAFDFIYPDSPRAAEAVFTAIMRATDSLAEFPNRGRPGPLTGTRELVVSGTGHIVTYAIENDTVFIIRVRHGRQDRT